MQRGISRGLQKLYGQIVITSCTSGGDAEFSVSDIYLRYIFIGTSLKRTLKTENLLLIFIQKYCRIDKSVQTSFLGSVGRATHS